jgi:hypothetical protein
MWRAHGTAQITKVGGLDLEHALMTGLHADHLSRQESFFTIHWPRSPGGFMLVRLSFLIATAAGCSNNCQQLCENMADFAQDSCGISVPDKELQDCLVSFEKSTEDQEATCETYQNIQNEKGWTCDVVEKYFQDSTSKANDDTGAAVE